LALSDDCKEKHTNVKRKASSKTNAMVFSLLQTNPSMVSPAPPGGRNLNKTKRDFGYDAQNPFLYLTEIISCKDKANGWNMKSSFIMNYL
jgi:hypothetical protein